jgi:phosphatidylserine/phosphatidylglycerophosphate/cardiolipin synthase-like enzyme
VHYVGLLENGEDALLARLHLIGHARRSVEFQTFIWRNDESGQLLARTLIAAARRGVKVRVLVDYVGIAKDAEALAVFAGAHPNLEVRVYRPTARTLEKGHVGTILYALTNFKGANQRMHNKVMVVDDAVGITGGRNVENSYFNHALGMNFKDRDALVLGPAAISMADAFDAFWEYHHTVPAEALRDVARWKGKAEPPLPASTAVGRRLARLAQQAQRAALVEARLVSLLRPVASLEFVSDLPGKNGALLLNGGGRATAHVLRALEEADEELWIQSPYLVLESMGMKYFKRLRKEKPELSIRVSTNSFGSTDNLVAYAGNVRSRDRYVNQLGFRIGEYRAWPRDLRKVLPQFDWLKGQAREGVEALPERPPFVCIHAKSFVADEVLAFVGSFNLDPRSAHLNTECGLLMRDRALARELKAEIQRDLDPRNCWVIAPRHGNKPLLELQMLSRELTDLSPVDLSIFDASTAYGLKPGVEPVEWGDARFFQRFRDVGSFPGVQGRMSDRELMGRLLKLSTPLMDPLL